MAENASSQKSDVLDYCGKIKTIDFTKRVVTIVDPQGTPTILKWPEPLDVVLRKRKEGYYIKGTYLSDTQTMKTNEYWSEGNDVFAKARQAGHGGGRPYTPPRNEKAIMFGCALKTAGEVFTAGLGGNSNGQSFESTMDRIVAAAVKATEEGIKLAGVQ
jgi:hypothetical protein